MPPQEPEGKWRLLNPLSVRFSQPRIARHFRDGHLLHQTAKQFSEVPLEDIPAAQWPTPNDSASGAPPYDTVLLPPFPAIRVISWRPKLRRPDGEAEKDVYGDHILGKRAWFALDNRRLHSMQQAAAKLWPKRCCVVVQCIEEVPGTAIRELRKFRTTTEGRTVQLGARAGDMLEWTWSDDMPAGASSPDEVEPEGFFSEDLWDSHTWASQAMHVATRTAAEHAEEEAALEVVAAPAAASTRPTPGLPMHAGYAGHYQRPDRQFFLSPCPSIGWQYMDPAGKIQGPFGLEKMRLWHQHGFFYPTLNMRCDQTDHFTAFAELWPPGIPPFTFQVVRYKM
mmetsp:Transcript_12894/g.34969  ORF Transcript_12894/g.34969 Transcript_12894/m.34969 type:complete len:338 (+) Transcript_12894:79-1092(+)